MLTCPECGETYESVEPVLANLGYCVNITCLTDLSVLIAGLPRSGSKRAVTSASRPAR